MFERGLKEFLQHVFFPNLGIIGLVLGAAIAWVVFETIRQVTPPVDPRSGLEKLDPDDPEMMAEAFSHRGIVKKLAASLGRPEPTTVEEFTEQVRALGRYKNPASSS